MGRSLRTSRRAVTVAEVMMAFGILAVAILAIVSAFLGAIELNARSVDTAVATQVGRDFLERVNELGYDSVPDGTYTFVGANNDPQNGDGFPPAPYPKVVANGKDHYLQVRVSTKGATLKVVVVEVTSGKHGRATFETYLYPGYSVS